MGTDWVLVVTYYVTFQKDLIAFAVILDVLATDSYPSSTSHVPRVKRGHCDANCLLDGFDMKNPKSAFFYLT